MSQSGVSSSINCHNRSKPVATPTRPRPGWVIRNRAKLEAAATLAMALSAPALTAAAMLQTSGVA